MKPFSTALCAGLAGLAFGLAAAPAQAGSTSVAVAANFTAVAERLADAFTAKTGDDVQLSFGASGALYTQITQAAPFEIFLSADDTRPQKAVDEGYGVAGSVFTYAIGTLVLYSADPANPAGEAMLRANGFHKLAIADPEAAPYGAAAVEALKALDLYDAVAPKLVTGENISQTLQFVESGNAELGFVAASQVVGKSGSVWAVPADLYAPILQDAVLLKTGQDNPVAQAFFAFLGSDAARTIIADAGYGLIQAE